MASPLSFGLLLLLAVGSNAVTSPSSQCAYLEYYFGTATNGLLPSLLPSINSKCLSGFNTRNSSTFCVAECQSLYALYSQCAPFKAKDNTVQCGQFQNSYCPIYQDYQNSSFIYSTCNDSTYCSPSCASSIASVEASSGCCRADLLNVPKVVCNQQPIAPCPSVLNGGSVAAPSRECAYINAYLGQDVGNSLLASLTPSLSSVCRSVLSRYGASNYSCIAECQSLYALLERCSDVPTANVYSTLFCGVFNKQSCSSLLFNDTAQSLAQAVSTSCSNATYCSPSCLAAITGLEQYGGCCYASNLNGPKVLCGQQPIPYCSTILNTASGSAAIGFNALLIIFTGMLSVFL